MNTLGFLLFSSFGEYTGFSVVLYLFSLTAASCCFSLCTLVVFCPQATYEWFRYYKKPDGKPENTVHWNGECKNRVGILDLSMSSVCCCSKELQNLSNWYCDIQVCMFLGVGGGCFFFFSSCHCLKLYGTGSFYRSLVPCQSK